MLVFYGVSGESVFSLPTRQNTAAWSVRPTGGPTGRPAGRAILCIHCLFKINFPRANSIALKAKFGYSQFGAKLRKKHDFKYVSNDF